MAIRAVNEASSTTPIVGSFIGEDPIAAGFATSLARPGHWRAIAAAKAWSAVIRVVRAAKTTAR
jgi:hypothetical protein